ncbi:ATP-binding response regulator [Actibacterium sp. D379-3]
MVAALYVPGPVAGALLAAAAGTLAALVLLVRLIGGRARKGPLALADAFAAQDTAPGFVTDVDGQVIWRNPASAARFGTARQETLIRALGELFANPAAVIYRLQARVEAQGAAQEDVVTRRGHVRIAVHRIAPQTYFWRFDEMEERGGGRGAEALSLPFMTVGRNDTILFMNEAARRVLGGRAKSLDTIFPVLPIRSGAVAELRGADGPLPARIVEFETRTGRREIYFLPLDHGVASDNAGPFFDALPVALLKLNLTGEVTMANRLARDLLGQPAGAMNLTDLVEGLGRPVLDWLTEVAEDRIVNRAEVLRVRRDDKEVFLQVTLERIDDEGETGLVAVLHDATELKTLEAQFVQSQKMQAIGQLAGGVAHDFNNLLTAISGHCDLLLLRHDEGDPDFADLMQINQNANRAASLVRQLLAFSRKQTLRPEMVDLHETLTDLTHLLNRLVGERVWLTVSHDPNLTRIRADKRQLEQVIMNLVVNARDAMPEGGEIRIETTMHHLSEELHRDRALVAPGDYVLVRVIDEGQGIPADKLTKVFEPFYTTKRVGEGTGLGLSTAYGIIKQSGGFIFVDSAPGSGTCFTLYFPARAGGAADAVQERDILPDLPEMSLAAVGGSAHVQAAGSAAGPPAALDRARAAPGQGEGVVLLVEDEAPVRAFASRALRMRGYTVLEAGNAEEALETLKDDKINVDVFVTDVVMPGMDGPSWVRRALEARPETRVVFVSGYAENAFSEVQARIPNSVFLPKPFSLTELTTTVRDQMH